MAINNQSVVNINCLTLNQYTLKPFVYLSLLQKKRVTISDYSLVDRTSTLSNQFIDDYIDTARFAEKHSYALNGLGLKLSANPNTIQLDTLTNKINSF